MVVTNKVCSLRRILILLSLMEVQVTPLCLLFVRVCVCVSLKANSITLVKKTANQPCISVNVLSLDTNFVETTSQG